jgi:hypothetical protein
MMLAGLLLVVIIVVVLVHVFGDSVDDAVQHKAG